MHTILSPKKIKPKLQLNQYMDKIIEFAFPQSLK